MLRRFGIRWCAVGDRARQEVCDEQCEVTTSDGHDLERVGRRIGPVPQQRAKHHDPLERSQVQWLSSTSSKAAVHTLSIGHLPHQPSRLTSNASTLSIV
jgi:hypothetical protein